MNRYSEHELKEIINRLIPLYPDDVKLATEILLDEYQLSMHIASMIMILVRIRAEIKNAMTWPEMDARQCLFGTN